MAFTSFLNLAFYNQVMHSLPFDNFRNVLVFFSMPVVSFRVMNAIITIGSFIFADKLLIGIFAADEQKRVSMLTQQIQR
ncbi:MAG: hypothetical protein PW844_03040 [Pantoea sp.]|uniref:hypothetical protein n=1 Tax=Pantoea sp. TaxID=69393 RepID=UPI0023A09E28|nr:hypothetical protein [Pantoea sp.]MDE1185451.1 hypothetical protein [Pantoea sp.]